MGAWSALRIDCHVSTMRPVVGSFHGGRGRLIRGGRTCAACRTPPATSPCTRPHWPSSAWVRSVDRSPGSAASRVSPASSDAPCRGARPLRPSKPARSPRSPTVPPRRSAGRTWWCWPSHPAPTLELIGRLAPSLEPGAILTDVCSLKAPVMARARECGLDERFAGSHPLAGTHESGFVAARPDRLRGCVVYVCEGSGPDGAAHRPRRHALLGGRPGGAADPDRLRRARPAARMDQPPAAGRRVRAGQSLGRSAVGWGVLRDRRAGLDSPGREQSRHVAGHPAAKQRPAGRGPLQRRERAWRSCGT